MAGLFWQVPHGLGTLFKHRASETRGVERRERALDALGPMLALTLEKTEPENDLIQEVIA